MLEEAFFDYLFKGNPFCSTSGSVAMQSKRLLIVVYDSVLNSVFENLVFDFAKNKIINGEFAHIDIISFEPDCSAAQERVARLSFRGIFIIIVQRLPFLGHVSLFFQAPIVAKHLLGGCYGAVIARGPLAGYVLKTAVVWFVDTPFLVSNIVFTVQARGLAAEEARLAFNLKSSRSFFHRAFFSVKKVLLSSIERAVYKTRLWNVPVSISTVSLALKEYLIETFDASPENVFVDDSDIISLVDKSTVAISRNDLRDYLKIPYDAIVYGYSGSAKQWQCSRETVDFMAQKIAENPLAYAIILSTDLVEFQKLINKKTTDKHRFILRYIEPGHVLQWLSVCDYGLLLRYDDVVNWVSRPTKALEYLAVGLKIIHNNTVKWLIDHDAKTGISGSEITPHPTQTLPS